MLRELKLFNHGIRSCTLGNMKELSVYNLVCTSVQRVVVDVVLRFAAEVGQHLQDILPEIIAALALTRARLVQVTGAY